MSTTEEVAEKYVGPLLVGTLLNVWLFGLCLMQAHTYSQHCQSDPKWIKIMVLWTVIIEATSSAFASFVSYDYAVRDFGQPDKVLIRTPEFSAFILTIGMCSTTVQCFYGWRIKRLLGKAWLAWLIYGLAIVQMLCVTGVAAGDSIVTGFSKFQSAKPVRVLVIIWMVLAPTTDFFIAGLLVWFLRKSRTGFKKTDTMLNRLSKLTIQTGAITGFCAILGLLLFLSLPNFIHLLFIFTLPEIYGVCLMSSLNARSAWSTEMSGDQSYHFNTQRSGKMDTGRVHISTTIVTQADTYELGSGPHSFGNVTNEPSIAIVDMKRGASTAGNSTPRTEPQELDLKGGAASYPPNPYGAEADRHSSDTSFDADLENGPIPKARESHRVGWQDAL